VQVLASAKASADAGAAAHQLSRQRVHASAMRKIMAMAAVIGEYDVGAVEIANDAHSIRFLADTSVSRAKETAFAELVERSFLEQANAKHLAHQFGY
jgi:hypothetical protein